MNNQSNNKLSKFTKLVIILFSLNMTHQVYAVFKPTLPFKTGARPPKQSPRNTGSPVINPGYLEGGVIDDKTSWRGIPFEPDEQYISSDTTLPEPEGNGNTVDELTETQAVTKSPTCIIHDNKHPAISFFAQSTIAADKNDIPGINVSLIKVDRVLTTDCRITDNKDGTYTIVYANGDTYDGMAIVLEPTNNTDTDEEIQINTARTALPHGQGVLRRFVDGSRFEGQWIQGVLNKHKVNKDVEGVGNAATIIPGFVEADIVNTYKSDSKLYKEYSIKFNKPDSSIAAAGDIVSELEHHNKDGMFTIIKGRLVLNLDLGIDVASSRVDGMYSYDLDGNLIRFIDGNLVLNPDLSIDVASSRVHNVLYYQAGTTSSILFIDGNLVLNPDLSIDVASSRVNGMTYNQAGNHIRSIYGNLVLNLNLSINVASSRVNSMWYYQAGKTTRVIRGNLVLNLNLSINVASSRVNSIAYHEDGKKPVLEINGNTTGSITIEINSDGNITAGAIISSAVFYIQGKRTSEIDGKLVFNPDLSIDVASSRVDSIIYYTNGVQSREITGKLVLNPDLSIDVASSRVDSIIYYTNGVQSREITGKLVLNLDLGIDVASSRVSQVTIFQYRERFVRQIYGTLAIDHAGNIRSGSRGDLIKDYDDKKLVKSFSNVILDSNGDILESAKNPMKN